MLACMLPAPQAKADRLPPPNPPRRVPRREPAYRRHLDASRWGQPPPLMLALRVSVLDRLLGRTVDTVRDLERVQSLILSRQNCARQAIEGSMANGVARWPSYLVNPIGALGCWPLPYAETPTV